MSNKALRIQNKIERLGTRNPKCAICGETDITKFHIAEEHHIAGAHEGETLLLCLNCHARCSDEQNDWLPGVNDKKRTPEMQAVGFFNGLADILQYLAELCRKFANIIYEFVTQNQKAVC